MKHIRISPIFFILGGAESPFYFGWVTIPIYVGWGRIPILFWVRQNSHFIFWCGRIPILYGWCRIPILFGWRRNPILFGWRRNPILYRCGRNHILYRSGRNPLLHLLAIFLAICQSVLLISLFKRKIISKVCNALLCYLYEE